MRDFEKERKRWIPIVDFHTWEILKVLQYGPRRSFREILSLVKGSPNSLLARFNALCSYGVILKTEEGYVLNPEYSDLLKGFDLIGDVVERIRQKHPNATHLKLKGQQPRISW